jgi:hypothetical protein
MVSTLLQRRKTKKPHLCEGRGKNFVSTVKSESIDSSGDKRDDEAYTHGRTPYLLVAYYLGTF